MSYQENQTAGVSQFQFKHAGSIRKGDFCMLLEQPCKIIDLAVSKPGKHGSAKICFTGINIFTDKKIQAIQSTSSSVMVPIVRKYELEVADISQDNFVALILPNSSLKEDLKLPIDEEESKKLKTIWESNKEDCSIYFTIIWALSQEKIVGSRTVKNY